MVHSIEEDTARLLRLTAELLNLTQLETGNIQLRIEPVRAQQIIDGAIPAVAMQAQVSGITIRQSIPESLPLMLADAEKTVLVLVNL
ncbi:hypothetical protein OFO29_34885, partial [Escherichia coli]|nr:hypothetical protein [Escherichia coli]